MRMWSTDPEDMCDQHLRGEHVELHMIVGCLNKGTNMEGYYDKGLVDTNLIEHRHQQIVAEMIARGWNHKSPLPPFQNPRRGHLAGNLLERCITCAERAHKNVYI